MTLRGVPRNRRCRGTDVIALRAALFVQECASCGGFGRNLLSCGLSALTKRKSGRGARTKRKSGRGARTKRKSGRGRPARNAIPAEAPRRAASKGREIVGKAVETVERKGWDGSEPTFVPAIRASCTIRRDAIRRVRSAPASHGIECRFCADVGGYSAGLTPARGDVPPFFRCCGLRSAGLTSARNFTPRLTLAWPQGRRFGRILPQGRQSRGNLPHERRSHGRRATRTQDTGKPATRKSIARNAVTPT